VTALINDQLHCHLQVFPWQVLTVLVPPILCSTPKSLSRTSAEENDWQDDGYDTVKNDKATETVESPEQERDQQENDLSMFFHYTLYSHNVFCIVQG